MTQNKTKLIYQVLAFVLPFIAYVVTLAPTVTFIDSGELATVCAKLGVAHPTGYPLFSIIGHIFTWLPTNSVIYSLNLMCAVISSLAIVMFFNLMVFIFTKLKLSDDTTEENKKSFSELTIYNISLGAGLVLAFSKTFWDTANAIEVYSLHTFFIITCIYLFLKACNYTSNNSKENLLIREKYWILFAFVLGLSFSNHLTTIFLSVGFLYLYFSVNGFNEISFKRILILAAPFILGLSVYIYLPVRADNPVLDWGHPDTWSNFYRHVSGKQFSIWMFSGTENASKQLAYFTKNFPLEFFYIPLIIAILGLIEIFNKSKKLFYYTILLFGFCVVYAINYDIYDIDTYFLLAYITASIWIGFGFYFIVKKFADDKRRTASFILILVSLLPMTNNYKLVDESKNYYVKDYTFNIFNSAPQGSIILSHQWDFWVSASIYFNFVENIRKDLIIIDKELLRKSWYIGYLKTHYPDMYSASKFEFDIYYAELLKFEKFTDRYTKPTTDADRQDLMKIQKGFADLLTSIVNKSYGHRDFFTTFEIESEKQERFGNEYLRVPEGMLIKYTKETAYDNYNQPEFTHQPQTNDGYHQTFIMNAYYNAYLSRANYLMNFTKLDEAEKLITKAMEVNPKGPESMQMLNKIRQLRALPK